jgi:hypothetical protein
MLERAVRAAVTLDGQRRPWVSQGESHPFARCAALTRTIAVVRLGACRAYIRRLV